MNYADYRDLNTEEICNKLTLVSEKYDYMGGIRGPDKSTPTESNLLKHLFQSFIRGKCELAIGIGSFPRQVSYLLRTSDGLELLKEAAFNAGIHYIAHCQNAVYVLRRLGGEVEKIAQSLGYILSYTRTSTQLFNWKQSVTEHLQIINELVNPVHKAPIPVRKKTPARKKLVKKVIKVKKPVVTRITRIGKK